MRRWKTLRSEYDVEEVSPTKVFLLRGAQRSVLYETTLGFTHSKGWKETQMANDHATNATFLVKAVRMST